MANMYQGALSVRDKRGRLLSRRWRRKIVIKYHTINKNERPLIELKEVKQWFE